MRDMQNAISVGLKHLPASMDTPSARAMLYAIALQESAGIHRWQIVNPSHPERMGPARGFWQFELGGGVLGVLTHVSSKPHAKNLCEHYMLNPVAYQVYALLHRPAYDGLAAGFARLLLWTDAQALPEPELDQTDTAWDYYLRVWRPGKPHRSTWDECFRQGVEYAQRIQARQ